MFSLKKIFTQFLIVQNDWLAICQRDQRLPSNLRLSTQRMRAGWSSHRWRGMGQHLQVQKCLLALTGLRTVGWMKTGLSRDSVWQPYGEQYSEGFPEFHFGSSKIQSHIKELRQRGGVSKAGRWQGCSALGSAGRVLRDQRMLRFYLFSQVTGFCG